MPSRKTTYANLGRDGGGPGSYVYTVVSTRHHEKEIKQASASKEGRTVRRRVDGWVPASLWTRSLLGFATFFTCLLVALFLLQHFDKKHQGLKMITKNHYVWTLTPTAFFVVVVAFWRLIDFHCKALQPWSELSRGPATAERTILLDHVSPFHLITLYSAVKKGHFTVLATIIGFLTLKLVTVASTGLLTPSIVHVGPVPIDLKYVQKFSNGTELWDPSQDPTPFYTAYAILTKGYKPADGTAETLAYETFEPVQRDLPNMTYSANVQAFVPQIDCMQFPINVTFDADGGVLLQSQTTAEWSCADALFVISPQCGSSSNSCPSRVIRPVSMAAECTSELLGQIMQGFTFILLDIRFTPSFNLSENGSAHGRYVDSVTNTTYKVEVPKTRSVFCHTAYSMENITVTYNSSDSSTKAVFLRGNTRSNLTLPGADMDDFPRRLRMSLAAASQAYGNTEYDLEGLVSIVPRLMANHTGVDYHYFLDNGDAMTASATDVMTTMAVQIGRNYLLNDNSALEGHLTYTSERLRVQQPPLFVIMGRIIVMLLLTILVLLTRPTNVTRYNPESLNALAGILSSSDSLHSLLAQSSRCSEQQASKILAGHRYSTRPGMDETAQTVDVDVNVVRIVKKSGSRAWWKQLTLRRPFLALTLSSSLVLIVLPQVLQRLSDSRTGLFSVQHDGSFTIGLYTRFLPALVMLLAATMYNCFDFNAATLAPLSAMRLSSQEDIVLQKQPLAQLPPFFLWHAFRQRYWTACLTTVAAITGSSLTIIVANLYTVHNISYPTSLSLDIGDNWNLSLPGGSLGSGGVALTVSLQESLNLSYTPSTFGELAFPNFTVRQTRSSNQISNSTGVLKVRLPALRSELSCIDIDSRRYTFSTFYFDRDTRISIDTTVPLREWFGTSTSLS